MLPPGNRNCNWQLIYPNLIVHYIQLVFIEVLANYEMQLNMKLTLIFSSWAQNIYFIYA